MFPAAMARHSVPRKEDLWSMANKLDKQRSEGGTNGDRYLDIYTQVSESENTLQRFTSLRDMILRVLKKRSDELVDLQVADIGCGAGTQSILWAKNGHRHIYGIDIHEGSIKLGKQRAAAGGYPVAFCVGSSTELPWADETMDLCLVPEVLEHVPEWRTCLKECTRILRPGGLLVITTNNKLCPIQEEFKLPLYSWYPRWVKKYCERLAVTTHPQLVNYTRYPAVNWFSYYMLREELQRIGFGRCLDRFEVTDVERRGKLLRMLIRSVQTVPLLRWLGQVTSVGTVIVAFKAGGHSKQSALHDAR
jgi:ubiquinone/menaquinone biosynthesis C-methylase UbiE